VDTSMPVPPSPSPSFRLLSGLGQALRWLREKQSRKQYRVADLAGITKGMLSAYETGRQRPSLDTLEKLLETLGCDLNGLHNALQLVNGRPDLVKSWSGWQGLGWPGAPASGGARALGAVGNLGNLGNINEVSDIREDGEPYHANDLDGPDRPGGLSGTSWAGGDLADLHRVLGTDQPRLAEEEERALGQMLAGFHGLMRYGLRSLSALSTLSTPPAANRPIPPRSLPRPHQPRQPSSGPQPSQPSQRDFDDDD
jgi:transcriptional regulator with XRE-family HTH domain